MTKDYDYDKYDEGPGMTKDPGMTNPGMTEDDERFGV